MNSSEITFRDERKPVVVFYDIQLDDAGLNPFQFRIYQRIARRCTGQAEGRCTESLNSMAEACEMSRPTAVRAVKVLKQRQMIRSEGQQGFESTYALLDKSKWISKKAWLEWLEAEAKKKAEGGQPGKAEIQVDDEETGGNLETTDPPPGKAVIHPPETSDMAPVSDVTTKNNKKSSYRKNISSANAAAKFAGSSAPFDSPEINGGGFGESGPTANQPKQPGAKGKKKPTAARKTKTAGTPANGTGRPWTDPFCDAFQILHQARWDDCKAQLTGRDFKAFESALASYGEKFNLDNWGQACTHYFQSPPKPKHSIFHLIEMFPVYLLSPLDRFNNPINQQQTGANNATTSNTRKSFNQNAAEQTLSAAYAAINWDDDNGSGQGLDIGPDAAAFEAPGPDRRYDPASTAPKSIAA